MPPGDSFIALWRVDRDAIRMFNYPMKKTFANLTSIVGGELAIRIANFAAAVVIARLYGAASLGFYATALAFATIVGTIGDNGLSISAVSEVSRRLDEIDRVVSALYVTKTALFSIVLACAAILIAWLHLGRVEWLIGALVLLKVLLNSYGALHFGVLKSLNRMRTVGLIQVLHAGVLVSGIGVVYMQHRSIVTLLLVLLGGQFLELLTSGAVVYLNEVRLVRVYKSDCWRLVAFSTPIGGASLISAVILRMDVLTISVLFSAAQVGHFAAANNGLIIIYLVGNLFGNVLLPEMVRMSRSDLDKYIARWIRLIFAITVPIAIGIAAVAKTLIVAVYGHSFADAGILASVMVLAMPFIIMNYLYFNRAIALQKHRCYLSVYMTTAILAITLNFTLAHTFGPTGVAAAILIREVSMFMMYAALARQDAKVLREDPVTVSLC
jgi:O-antigen/teichoic acid export membrane protein